MSENVAHWMCYLIAKTEVSGSNPIQPFFFSVEKANSLKHIFAFDFSTQPIYFGLYHYFFFFFIFFYILFILQYFIQFISADTN